VDLPAEDEVDELWQVLAHRRGAAVQVDVLEEQPRCGSSCPDISRPDIVR
jgi:hypothetical protein